MVEQLPHSRAAAVNTESTHYQGRPCKVSGHNGIRYTSNGRCCQCKIERQRVFRKKGQTGCDDTRNNEQLPQAHKVNALWLMPTKKKPHVEDAQKRYDQWLIERTTHQKVDVAWSDTLSDGRVAIVRKRFMRKKYWWEERFM